MQNKDCIKINDIVSWCGSWGAAPPKLAKVVGLGVSATDSTLESIPWEDLRGRKYFAILENGHWAYGEQLKKVVEHE